ncbi:MAG: DUF2058 domain-containing protein [Methylococcales bacterium]
MGNSLQDQLLKAGVINKQKAGKVNAEKRKKVKQSRQTKTNDVDENKLAVQQAQAAKAEKDRLLNQRRQEQLQLKAIEAQIQQLIANNRQPQNDTETAYNFSDNNIVKKIYISETIREQLGKGQLAIVKLDEKYEVVPAIIAKKISERNRNYVIVLNESTDSSDIDENDAYADYQIPDDLMW